MAEPFTIKRLESGYWHLRGIGPCNWAQPLFWPCADLAQLEASFFEEAGEPFRRARFVPRTNGYWRCLWGTAPPEINPERRPEHVFEEFREMHRGAGASATGREQRSGGD